MVDLTRQMSSRQTQLTAVAAVWSRCGGGLHSKLAAAAAATVARLWFWTAVAGCHVPVASAG